MVGTQTAPPANVSERLARRLTAILVADVVGSTRMMEQDEVGTLAAMHAFMTEVAASVVANHWGNVIKTTGDGALVEFSSPVEAVICAFEVQRRLSDWVSPKLGARHLSLRIGINLGDVVCGPDGDLYGDGVNVAVRLQQIAEPGSICISAKVFDELHGSLTKRFEDRGEQFLKNLARPIHIYVAREVVPGRQALTYDARAFPLLKLPDKPSIAVLPFRNMSEDKDADYLADGIVEDILTALGRFKWLFVSARGSTFIYKGQTLSPKVVGAELGVRYLLDGSIRRFGDRMRITGRLVEAERGTQIWADRYDGTVEDIFELQDRITESVAGAVEPRLRYAEIERVRRTPPEKLSSYDQFLRALACFYGGTREEVEQALQLLEETTRNDPGYAQPYALKAWCYVYYIAQGWSRDPATDGTLGIKAARAAIEREREDPTVLWMSAQAIGYLAHDIDTALFLLDRALVLNPSSAPAYTMSGWVRCWAGRPHEAIPHFHCAMRLSPFDRTMVAMLSGLALALCMDGKYEESIEWAQRAVNEQENWTASYRPLISSLAHLGRMDEARCGIEQLLARDPDYRVSSVRSLYRPSPGADRYLQGLIKAGLLE
ncbi:adenylate/guanylate cyclase domain-containing protein [Microvirga massiliensis]|uniref:adenylate/guanylate cyclase domain-containing protein n=1 Tax=Microvirga massiliensis TaxID=1033741 RepID=UPI00062B879E|nr:adenylate/guanylate cyclase domain-containing protein [Microvirga massiliensis]